MIGVDYVARVDVVGSPLLTIVVPVYNEAATAAMVVERLLTIDLPLAREVIVVDDGSRDRTAETLARFAPGTQLPAPGTQHPTPGTLVIPTVRVIRFERNQGKGSAIRRGIAEMRGSIVAIQDADLELDPSQLAALVQPILKGEAQVVYGSRFLLGRPRMSALAFYANCCLTAFTNLLFRSRLTDMETCYKVMTAGVARSLRLESTRFEIEAEITAKLLKSGHRIHELPVRFEPRSRSQGKKIGWRDGIQAVRTLCRCRLQR